MEYYLSLIAKSIFIENILLAYFLGMCSFLAISKNIEASIGLGKAVIFVNTLTVPLNWFILKYFLEENALYSWTEIESLKGVDLSYLGLLTFIATIAELEARTFPSDKTGTISPVNVSLLNIIR